MIWWFDDLILIWYNHGRPTVALMGGRSIHRKWADRVTGVNECSVGPLGLLGARGAMLSKCGGAFVRYGLNTDNNKNGLGRYLVLNPFKTNKLQLLHCLTERDSILSLTSPVPKLPIQRRWNFARISLSYGDPNFGLFRSFGLLCGYLATLNAKSDVIFLLGDPDFL